MLADGIHVILKGKFIGSDKHGPWAGLFYMFDIDVFKLGPLFISIFTLWYLPVGTIFSIIVLIVLITAKSKNANGI